MTEQFKDQGGAATMDPSDFRRWVTSKVLSRLIRPSTEQRRHAKAEQERARAGEPHRVDPE